MKHALAGVPTCTQAQIDERHAICKACELYRPDDENHEVGVCTHAACGCSIKRDAWFVNKLAWADQECPVGKWPKLA